jgi:hypothetical protein
MPIVAGIRMPREQALELAALLTRSGSDHTARVLLRAITNGEEFVALRTEEREAILAALDGAPPTFAALRSVLFDELNWRRSVGVQAGPTAHGS